MLNIEEGSEYNYPDGDGRSETTLTDAGMGPTGGASGMYMSSLCSGTEGSP